MHTAQCSLACCLATLVLSACVTPPAAREVQFSGITRQDVREIERLVAQRTDILKPVISVHVLSTIPASNSLNGKIQVVAGRDDRVGDTFDTFTVAKRRGGWAITSRIERDSILISTY